MVIFPLMIKTAAYGFNLQGPTLPCRASTARVFVCIFAGIPSKMYHIIFLLGLFS